MIEEVIRLLKTDPRFSNKVEHIETLKPKEAIYQNINDLPDNLKNYLEDNSIKLYSHQAEAFKLIRAQENVIITTPTSSGKTLSFNLPIFEKLSENQEASALYIYPAKALCNDQLHVLQDLEAQCGLKIKPNIYDGDTDNDIKPWIRENSRIVITNPYMLHRTLSWHHQWENFYRNLKFVVVDEAHYYRGVKGSNVAILLRRLRRICNHYGSDPQFILSSATLANPEEFSSKLVGKKFALIDKDGSPRGKKNFVLYNPYVKWGNLSTTQETNNIFQLFVLNNIQTLCFTVSRRMAEIITILSKKDLSEKSDVFKRITSYRAGYLASDRRKIENSLKNRDLLGVTCTNALELGVDIGSLEGIIICGYPGTIISTWQQAGRAGRTLNESIIVLVAFYNSLDQYLMRNPKFIFEKSNENAVIDIKNKIIIKSQLLCAINELPLNIHEIKNYFEANEKDIEDLERKGLIRERETGWTYIGRRNPALDSNLDLNSEVNFKVFHNHRLLENLDQFHAFTEAHKGAVFLNQGETYIVRSFDLEKRIINVEKEDVDFYTQTMRDSNVEIINEIEKHDIGDFSVSYGELKVSQEFYKYKVLLYGKTISVHDLNLPPITYKTKGLWFTLPDTLADNLENYFNDKDAYAGSLHGVEHSLISMFPLLILCDRFDVGGLSTNNHPNTGKATIFIYDAYEEGIGLSEKAVELIEKLVEVTRDMVKSCDCEDGCPTCIYSPKCGNDNKPLHKAGTIYVLEAILSFIKSQKLPAHPEKIDSKNSQKLLNNPNRAPISSDAYQEAESSKSFNYSNKNFKDFSDIIRENLSYYGTDYESFIDHGPDLFKLTSSIIQYEGLDFQMKSKLFTALAYFVTPNDVIPEDIYGPYGYIDDIFLCTYVLKEVSSRIGYEVLENYWNCNYNLKDVIELCYNESSSILGDKTNKILNYVAFPEISPISDLTLNDFLCKGECDIVEYKSTLLWDIKQNNANKKMQYIIVKSIAGFLNSNGGTLLIGVRDDATIYGIENDMQCLHKKDKDGFEQRLIQIIENNLGLNIIEHINITFEEKDGKYVCLVKIKPSPEPIFVESQKKQYFYLRAGNTTKPLDNKQQFKYINRHWNRIMKGLKDE